MLLLLNRQLCGSCQKFYLPVARLTSSAADADLVRQKLIARIIRVDHAGEMGASFIYKGIILVS